jgi:imidazole glycerol-phosphate synthase subunit HisF
MTNKIVRIIPRLDIKGPNLVKGIHLEGLRVLGEPESFASHYYNNMADELILMDVVASLYGRNSLHEIISKTAQEIFIPITVGGGLRSIEDIKDILRTGADKVSINTAAIERPELIREASLSFGSSTIVSSVECIKHEDNNYYAYSDNGREFSGKNVFEWVEELEYLGAGEINICSVDKEGTRSGYDIELIKKINDLVSIPVIAHGGAGKLNHISDLILNTGVDAVSFSSITHYDFIKKNVIDITSLKEGNNEYLKNNNKIKFETFSVEEIKNHLYNKGIKCRY